MKWPCLGALVLACTMIAVAQAPVRDAKAERSMIIALENAWNQAQIHHDGEDGQLCLYGLGWHALE